MGFKIGADLDLQVLVESMNRLEKQQAETNKRLREYLRIPHANHRVLYNNYDLARNLTLAQITPPIIDLGEVPPGLQWDIKQVVCWANDPLAFLQGAAAGSATQVQNNQAGTGAASAIVLTVPAVSQKTNFVSGFTVSGTGATAGSIIVITLAGVQGGTQSFDYVVPAGVGAAAPTLEVNFNPPLAASGPNVAIVLTVPSFGAGNTNSAAELEAITQTGAGPIQGGVFVGFPPSPDRAATSQNNQDAIAVGLSVPFVQQFGGRIAVPRGGQHLYVAVALPAGVGFLNSLHASASVIEVPDTEECVTWL